MVGTRHNHFGMIVIRDNLDNDKKEEEGEEECIDEHIAVQSMNETTLIFSIFLYVLISFVCIDYSPSSLFCHVR